MNSRFSIRDPFTWPGKRVRIWSHRIRDGKFEGDSITGVVLEAHPVVTGVQLVLDTGDEILVWTQGPALQSHAEVLDD